LGPKKEQSGRKTKLDFRPHFEAIPMHSRVHAVRTDRL
jgi:hypothetical protein